MAQHRFNKYINRLIATEINRFSKYYESTAQVLPLETDNRELFDAIECDEKHVFEKTTAIKSQEDTYRRALILNGNFNHGADIQELLSDLYKRVGRGDRVVTVLCNPYFRWVYRVSNFFRSHESEERVTFVTNADLRNLSKLCNFEIIRLRNVGYVPFKLFGVGNFINRVMPAIPLLRWLSMA